MDGVDASIIQSDGENEYRGISDKYFEYPKNIYNNLTKIRDKIKNKDTLKEFSKKIKILEKDITLFHAKIVNELIRDTKANIDLVGFHGQTIFHNSLEKISKQLGDGKLLSQLTKKNVVYNFRKNDLNSGGEGAPLTPIYHQVLEKKFNIKPVNFINIGGILNRTTLWSDGELSAKDEGPGMCLIDEWVRLNSNKRYDKNGDIARSGKVNKIILNQYIDNFYSTNVEKKSYDTNDFDISFVRGLSLENGAATLTELTAEILSKKLLNNDIYVSGGGRKNKFLIYSIKKKIKSEIKEIDDLGLDGSFIESQAFGYLAIRSYLGLPISFPETTGCKEPTTGGTIVKSC
jgi:anhydro-N-acetylmuramic acid kinase